MALYAVDESTRYPASLIRVDTDDPIGARIGYQGARFDIIDKEIVIPVFLVIILAGCASTKPFLGFLAICRVLKLTCKLLIKSYILLKHLRIEDGFLRQA
ncbi:hypothetical protein ES703_84595 [subsurface metagenome]